MDDGVTNTVSTAVISSTVTAILVWISGKGWPVIKEAFGWMSDREKVIREQAKEGITMVNVRLELELNELKGRFEKLIEKYEGLQDKHRTCEIEQEKLRAKVAWQTEEIGEQKQEVTDLKNQLNELKKQQGIWQQIEMNARIAGDSKNAEAK